MNFQCKLVVMLNYFWSSKIYQYCGLATDSFGTKLLNIHIANACEVEITICNIHFFNGSNKNNSCSYQQQGLMKPVCVHVQVICKACLTIAFAVKFEFKTLSKTNIFLSYVWHRILWEIFNDKRLFVVLREWVSLHMKRVTQLEYFLYESPFNLCTLVLHYSEKKKNPEKIRFRVRCRFFI